MNLATRILARTAVVALVAVSAAFFAGCGSKDNDGDNDDGDGKKSEKKQDKKEAADKGEKELKAARDAIKAKKMEDAVKSLQSASDKGNTDAMFLLGFMYGEGKGVAENDEKALKYMKQSADAGNVKAKILLIAKQSEDKDISEKAALEKIKALESDLLKLAQADDGDAQALYALLCIMKLEDVDSMEEMSGIMEEAQKWVDKAKKNGSILADDADDDDDDE